MHVTTDISQFASYLQELGFLKDTRSIKLTSYLPAERTFPRRDVVRDSGLSHDQIDYICGMKPRNHMRAIKGKFYQITFINSETDSKDIFISPDFKLIYDAKPQWLGHYINAIKALELRSCRRNYLRSRCCVPGGLLSYSHFAGRNLAPFIVFGSSIDLPYVLPFARSWQQSIIDTYSTSTKIIHLDATDQILPNILLAGFEDSWLFEELMDWENLLLARGQLTNITARLDSNRNLSKPGHYGSDSLYISRLRYEVLCSKLPRTLNWPEILSILSFLDFKAIFPEAISISSLIGKIHNSDLIICDSGSAFINYVLFASSSTRIIQLSPIGALQQGNSFNLLSPLQWYLPVANQIIFFPSCQKTEVSDIDSFRWNEPCSYNTRKLSELVLILKNIPQI